MVLHDMADVGKSSSEVEAWLTFSLGRKARWQREADMLAACHGGMF